MPRLAGDTCVQGVQAPAVRAHPPHPRGGSGLLGPCICWGWASPAVRLVVTKASVYFWPGPMRSKWTGHYLVSASTLVFISGET